MDPIERVAQAVMELPGFLDLAREALYCSDLNQQGNLVDNCICHVDLSGGKLGSQIRNKYGDQFWDLFTRHGLKRDLGNYRRVIDQIVKRFVLTCRQQAFQKFGIQPTQNKVLLYRFVKPEEFAYNPKQGLSVTLRQLFDWGLVKRRELLQYGTLKNITYTIYPALYRLRSTGRQMLSIKEYLGPSKGVGGQISGWQTFNEQIDAVRHYSSLIGTVRGAWDAFSDTGRRALFVIPVQSLQGQGLLSRVIAEPKPSIEWVDLPGQIPRFAEQEDPVGGIVVRPEPGKLKMLRAGAAMPEGYTNPTEVNLVGDVDLQGFVVVPDINNTSAYELVMTALRNSNLLALANQAISAIDQPLPIHGDW